MPKKSQLKCYFGCKIDGPLHHFPTWEYPHTEKFEKWKSILDSKTQEKRNDFIHNNIRICHKHFEDYYQLPSKRLTGNAIPTLNLNMPLTKQIAVVVPSTSGPLQQMDLESQPILLPSTLPQSAHISCQTNSNKSINQLAQVVPSTSSLSQQLEVQSEFKSLPSPPKRRCLKQQSSDKYINKLKTSLLKLRQKCKTQSKKILAAKNLAMSKSFLSTIEKLPDAAQTFIKLQLKNKNKPRGRRYTFDEKIMALSILKQSPKAYKLLEKMFVLPSKRCLQKILSAFSIRPGVNKEIFENLENIVVRMPPEKRLVNLLFDEIAIAPGLIYNEFLKQIVGFKDDGITKTDDLADHALVFMIKGIKSKTKQPVCFTFVKSRTKRAELKALLLNIINEINNTGLRVVTTICDQCPTNVAVISELRNETRMKYAINDSQIMHFEVQDNIKVFPLFDTPHLLKGVRNNLIMKNVQFTQNGQEKYAKWEHLKMLLAMDKGDDEIRLVNKLTENHVNIEKLKKMKVKLAAQVFSQRVLSAIRFLARHGILPAEAEGTADFLLVFDKLFDSFNGHSYTGNSKIYKNPIKKNSPHFQLWDDLLPILESIKFESVKRKNNVDQIKLESVPSIKNWIINIKTFKELWTHLSTDYKIKNLVARNFNQDPLENFFSCIRSNGVRNVNPNCNQFMNAFKTLIFNNFNSPHSAGANCEQDNNTIMQSLSFFVHNNHNDSANVDYACNIDSLLNVIIQIKNNDSLLHAESKKYVTGYVIKKSKSKVFKNCTVCLNNLCRPNVDCDSFIYEVDYSKKSLFHPNDEFIQLMNNLYYVIVACLRDNPASKALINQIKFYIDCACDFNIIRCEKHKDQLIAFFCNLSIKLIVHSWCLGVNKLLNGKLSNFDRNDHVKLQAFDYYNKRRR